jgi:AraC family transcriptional regulator
MDVIHIHLAVDQCLAAFEMVYHDKAGAVEVTDFYGRDETLAHLSFACAEMLSARTAGNAKRVAAFAHLLAIHIAEKYTNVASQRPDYRGGLAIARLRKIEDYVRAHLAESISIETLAELAEPSPFHFSRVFKQTTGITPLQFLIRERMLQAQQLIRETSRSLIEIALEIGYTSPSHSLRYFGGRWAWLPLSFATLFRVRRAHRFSARIRRVPHDPESSHLADGRWSRRASMVQPRKKINKSYGHKSLVHFASRPNQ